MEIAATPQQPQDGVSTTTIIAGVMFIIALAGVGYYLIERNRTVAPIAPNQNVPIPGVPNVTPNAGAQAVGILTDKNFFSGLTDMATTIAGIVQSAKNNKGGKTDDSEDFKAPEVTGGGSTVLTGTAPSSNWGGWG